MQKRDFIRSKKVMSYCETKRREHNTISLDLLPLMQMEMPIRLQDKEETHSVDLGRISWRQPIFRYGI